MRVQTNQKTFRRKNESIGVGEGSGIVRKAPKTIYLQVGEDVDDYDDVSWADATWCIDKINDSDIEYVRADKLNTVEITKNPSPYKIQTTGGSDD